MLDVAYKGSYYGDRDWMRSHSMNEDAVRKNWKSKHAEIFGLKGFLIVSNVSVSPIFFMVSGTLVLLYLNGHCVLARAVFLNKR